MQYLVIEIGRRKTLPEKRADLRSRLRACLLNRFLDAFQKLGCQQPIGFRHKRLDARKIMVDQPDGDVGPRRNFSHRGTIAPGFRKAIERRTDQRLAPHFLRDTVMFRNWQLAHSVSLLAHHAAHRRSFPVIPDFHY